MEYVVELPLLIVLDAGVTAIEKSPFTTRVTFAVRVSDPLVPRTTNGYVPDGVAVLVAIVSDVEPAAVTEGGANAPVAPGGRPVTLKSTVPENPALGFTVAVNAALWPAITACDVGVADRVKFDTAMVRVAG